MVRLRRRTETLTAERDLRRILADLRIERRADTYVYVSLPSGSIPGAAATIREDEGVTYVIDRATAEREGLTWSFDAAWLTVDVTTALDGVGLTAALATALASAGIPCNVLAGFHHDHLLVPVERADEAVAALEALRRPS